MYDRGSGSSNPSEQTVELLAAAGRAVETLVAERIGVRGSSPLHQSVLKALADLGPHAHLDLATQIEAPLDDVVRVIDELMEQGLVHAMVVNIGGRHEVVTLTEAGTEALAATVDDVKSLQDALLASITKGERAQLHYLLRRVYTTATRADGLRSVSP
ncbi:MarR family winged helix-turn-helix transcriptional regulator [Streptomyces sp. NBC_01232]|uniref:MarR family winged helix-turn-helix transcriptional regulator n=1 Tax=Streptomyces sp. NBC_01232 TaxID=2903786 RepID=UPI002E10B272|nr:MarR family winged helix-turn-helix transcriptional regulator [Streptomyces sp. NBC_01232]